jgi:hypothetical protein
MALVETSRAITHIVSSDSLDLTITCLLGLFALVLLFVSCVPSLF